MDSTKAQRNCLLFMLFCAATVYVVAHWDALTDPYVINDDVRQQVYWMQRWQDPDLFPDDLLTRYAQNYVPWGVQAVYALGSLFMNPVQFSKVVAGILFVVTAGFLFGLVLQFRNERTAAVAVCVSFFFPSFLGKITGGLAQSFGYPLLLAYLFFLARGRLLPAGVVILLAATLNPYIFLLCLATHLIFLGVHYARKAVEGSPFGFSATRGGSVPSPRSSPRGRGGQAGCAPADRGVEGDQLGQQRGLLVSLLPVLAGIALMALKYVFLQPEEFGTLVSWADMADRVEYTAAGRLAILPVPSLLTELVRPWLEFLPFLLSEPIWGWIVAPVLIGMAFAAYRLRDGIVDLRGFGVFGYLMSASLLLHFTSYLVLMRLFIPERYLEYSLNILYCVVLAAVITVLGRRAGLQPVALWCVGLVSVIGALRCYNVGVFDYSEHAPLYRYLGTTPKSTLIAGHPELMDSIPTFARRKAFVTYELSHTWMDRYWGTIKGRTFDLFRAYYAQDPEAIVEFGRKYGIDYLVIREEDFDPKRIERKEIYFEPFGSFIRDRASGRSSFAVLDKRAFPPVFLQDRIRVLKIRKEDNGNHRP
ncbi:MAG: hypothetical protein HY914_11990 [Desulfomonile tiedjei]|nr:hypothetical protein [Desulfomonile tiedjei]